MIKGDETENAEIKRALGIGEKDNMFGNVSGIVHLTEILSVVILSGASGLILLKLRNLQVERQSLRYALKHQEYFDYVAANLEDDQPLNRPFGTLRPLERKIIQDKLFAWMRQIRGVQRTRLAELCRHMGFEAEQIKRLHSPFRWIQVDAAYNLGVMRSKEACPLLLELQADESFGAPLFIVARAIARSARNINDIRQMVKLIIEHRKDCYELVADILQDVNLDYSAVLIEWLQSEEEDYVKIGLLCLNGQTFLKVDKYLVKLFQSKHKEIRIQAVKVWLKQSVAPKPAMIVDFLAHSDWEIRAQAAKAAGALGSPVFLEPLKVTMEDDFWWVRHYSASSLAKLKESVERPLYEVLI
jgi:hypothetical protein